ncbi:hypothetical protein M3Y99_00368500 [Aphelenchoides fujianensis]|nr:hypothetical protein M3Y99_00368500 [Aphelenchoides fujianensis]
MIPPLLFALVLSAVAPTAHSLQCLVSRPGHGLVSEKCPPEAIACRIAVEHHSVIFYPWSPIYDRNQFACVMPNEFKDVHGSGCIQKRSGRVRCWCFGQVRLQHAGELESSSTKPSASKDAARLQAAVDLLDSPDGTKEPPPSTTSTTKPTAKSMRKHTHLPTTMPTTKKEELSTRPPFNLKPKVMPRPTEEARSHVEFMPPPPKHHRHSAERPVRTFRQTSK